ncbi:MULTISPECIES: hypothetical protein [Streptococcus]|uniref:Lipoprotein n=1 Tax=Streptococcus suis TaxID=1307 RepID=A0A0Z8HRD5_STRSU|nr:hypothetical protein [Streptococcus suis]MBM0196034.1 hypothetical protein [Streptococcus suis]MBM7317552.1 hypothetical protein [Streptococcus suis]MCK4074969.1 hypothetical protein [Streptococcus suis]MCL4923614.1 hypothetical protein [Streptococcus suis]MDW8715123.1 hypothetical protein [Streptococcus suis]
MKKKLLRLGFVALSVLVLTACQVGTKEYLSVSFKKKILLLKLLQISMFTISLN